MPRSCGHGHHNTSTAVERACAIRSTSSGSGLSGAAPIRNRRTSCRHGFLVLARARDDEVADLPHADLLEDAIRHREEAVLAPTWEPANFAKLAVLVFVADQPDRSLARRGHRQRHEPNVRP